MFSKNNYIIPRWNLYSTKSFISSTARIVLKENLPAAAYQPSLVERNKYAKWEKHGLFEPDNPCEKPTFSMVLPPPNVTGKLHLGHALTCTIQDVIVRRKRSMGYNVLWLPGIDHAGIATQGVVEKHLKTKFNINRHDISRERFNNKVWKWKARYGNTICEQLKTLGCSLNWNRQTFTMDPKHTQAVNDAFIKLFKKGLIYRKKALINWCNKLKSTVSDIEVDNLSLSDPTDIKLPDYDKPVKFGFLYDFAYQIVDSNECIVVSTTMPETMLGDTAIAVHPEDKRYFHLRGKRAVHPFRKETIPIIFDRFVDMKFGTGAVKITPAHSKIDYEVGQTHNLPMIQVINEDRRIINAEKFNGMKRYDCRQILVQILEEMGLLKNMRPHQMSLPICSRTGDVIEQLPKEQWFLACSDLNKMASNLVESGKLKIEPGKFVKNWHNWTENERDWCISRQLWWGHQIPAYKCTVGHNSVWVAAADETAAKIEASKHLRTLPALIEAERDTDVLDTWFSSGIYPFAALNWPDHYNEDYKKFYPLTLMTTGHDILGFWVHKMVMLGLELTGRPPFNNVLLHGIICDSKGAKMSKSRGNVIDPIDIINGISLNGLRDKSDEMHSEGTLSDVELKKALDYHKTNFSKTDGIPECGVDALRFTLLAHDIKSHFVNFDVEQCHANKLFCNKIWQSIKYMQLQFAKLVVTYNEITQDELTFFDRWILSRLADMVKIVNQSFDAYNFHTATKAMRALIYNEFCDVYLEATKPGFEKTYSNIGYAHAHTLSVVLNTSLRCLSPVMVYLTDELIPKIPAFETNIIHNFKDASNKYYDFPKNEDFEPWSNNNLEKQTERILNTISLVRQLKSLYCMNKVRPCVWIETSNESLKSDMQENRDIVLHLARSCDICFEENTNLKYVSGILDKNTKVSVEIVGEDVDSVILAARSKLEKKVKKMEDSLSRLEAKLSTDRYLNHVSDWTKVLDREALISKKEELQQLKRLIV